ncbi:hypothetical protein H2201_004819 [Coniosporium apollinis]|uniref:Uncharacterized protein n=1 Tax=Coniosporium apollinis TaxID=61459 RepID=A0ABQ9NTC5_9PEZI|nr:hypothetical protein H2201_004819 [Coniosporium apollinis]
MSEVDRITVSWPSWPSSDRELAAPLRYTVGELLKYLDEDEAALHFPPVTLYNPVTPNVMPSTLTANQQCLQERLWQAVSDLYEYGEKTPTAVTTEQVALMAAYPPEKLAAELFSCIPTEVQYVLGSRETITIDDLRPLSCVSLCQPDGQLSVYLGMGISTIDIACLHASMPTV